MTVEMQCVQCKYLALVGPQEEQPMCPKCFSPMATTRKSGASMSGLAPETIAADMAIANFCNLVLRMQDEGRLSRQDYSAARRVGLEWLDESGVPKMSHGHILTMLQRLPPEQVSHE